VVTLAEVEYGHRVTKTPDHLTQAAYRNFIDREIAPVLEISRHIHEPYALLRAWLFENYSPRNKRTKTRRPEELVDPTTARELGIDENDLWIAAHAALHNFVLVTADRLSHLANAIQEAGTGPKLEDWTRL
jgi:predicted nucleic acid-binding protein